MLKSLYRFVTRWRYPVCCPEDIATALGIELPNYLAFEELVAQLSHSGIRSLNLEKYMKRADAEALFSNSQRLERFQNSTLVSYYFCEGWMEFHLHFDSNGRLRRIYLHHQHILVAQGIEIALKQQPKAAYQQQKLSDYNSISALNR